MTSESTSRHKAAAAAGENTRSVPCSVITVSDTRTPATDKGGDLVVRLLTEAGHTLVDRTIVPDNPDAIATAIEMRLADPRVRALLLTGGTGIAPRDTTIEVVRSRLTVEMPGFGELFRMLSYQHVGASAMLSRAVAGLVAHDGAAGGDTFVFAMPGSVNAVEVAMTKLIVPELSHLVWERSR